MKKLFLTGALAGGLLVSVAEIVEAQHTTTQQGLTATAADQAGPKVILAGWLDRGPGGEYILFGPNLNRWVLNCDSVDLDLARMLKEEFACSVCTIGF
jgi:hypothetical protein